jgi:ankyrin repeat protein
MSIEEVIAELKTAFCNDDAAAVGTLLDRHPDLKSRINEPVAAFDSPAILAVRSRDMLDVLLAAGADINAKSHWWAGGFGLLHTADPHLAAYAIARGATVDVHAAARLGLLDELKRLLSADPALVHAGGGDGQTPLHFASTIEIAACLLEHGAAIDARDVDHESTPAQYMLSDRKDVARFLVERGCATDLLMAAALDDAGLARRILDAEPDAIRLRVSDEYFPMVGGMTGGTIYQWTLGWYVSAHQVARKFGHAEMYQLLMDASPAEVRLLVACWLGDEPAASTLLKAAPDLVSRLNENDRRQLAHAARNNDLAATRLMSAIGLPVDGLSQHGAGALHWAAFHGNAAMVDMLLARRPPLEAADPTHNATPLGWAIHGSEHGWDRAAGDYPATVEALLRAGAKPPAEVSGSNAVQETLRRLVSNPAAARNDPRP